LSNLWIDSTKKNTESRNRNS